MSEEEQGGADGQVEEGGERGEQQAREEGEGEEDGDDEQPQCPDAEGGAAGGRPAVQILRARAAGKEVGPLWVGGVTDDSTGSEQQKSSKREEKGM